MHAVGFVIGVPEDQLDSVLERYLEDYKDEESYYIFWEDNDEYETWDELVKNHPEVKTDDSLYGRVNPYAQCDYYSIGGRWGNYFLLKDGSRSSSTTIGQIDFDQMEQNAKELATRRYNIALEAIGGDKNFKTLAQYEKEYEDWSIAREKWASQKQVKDWNEWRRNNDTDYSFFDFSIDRLQEPLYRYQDEVVSNKMVPVAVIKDWSWDELPSDARSALSWLKKFKQLPPDTEVSMIDYHI